MNENIIIKQKVTNIEKVVTKKPPIMLFLLLIFSGISIFLDIINFVQWTTSILILSALVSMITTIVLIIGVVISVKDKNFKVMYLYILIMLGSTMMVSIMIGNAVTNELPQNIKTENFVTSTGEVNLSLAHDKFYSNPLLKGSFVITEILTFFDFLIILYIVLTGRKKELKNRLTKEGYEIINEENLNQENKDFIQKALQK